MYIITVILRDTAIKTVTTNTMTVTLDKRDYVFVATDILTYIHMEIGIIKHENGGAYLNCFRRYLALNRCVRQLSLVMLITTKILN